MEQLDPLESLFQRAKANGVPMAAICKKAEIAPTTPSRWKRGKNGATLDRIQRLNDALTEILAVRPTPSKAAASRAQVAATV